MQNIYFKYLKKLLIFSLIIIGIEWGLSLIVDPVWVSNAWWVTALFFVALDIITYRLVTFIIILIGNSSICFAQQSRCQSLYPYLFYQLHRFYPF